MLSLTIRYCLQRAVCNLSAKKPDILHIKFLEQFFRAKMTSFDLTVFQNEVVWHLCSSYRLHNRRVPHKSVTNR